MKKRPPHPQRPPHLKIVRNAGHDGNRRERWGHGDAEEMLATTAMEEMHGLKREKDITDSTAHTE
jgi:hypothetical protein